MSSFAPSSIFSEKSSESGCKFNTVQSCTVENEESKKSTFELSVSKKKHSTINFCSISEEKKNNKNEEENVFYLTYETTKENEKKVYLEKRSVFQTALSWLKKRHGEGADRKKYYETLANTFCY